MENVRAYHWPVLARSLYRPSCGYDAMGYGDRTAARMYHKCTVGVTPAKESK